jgi:hypothetical protein
LQRIRIEENPVAKKTFDLVAIACVSVLVSLDASQHVKAQAAAPYPAMAPLSEYLIPDAASEIQLARSAAPASISGGAEVLVLTKGGYVTAAKGGNGFVCIVERSWGKSTDDPEFWNPKVSAPHCLNEPAARSYLPIVLLKTTMVLAGKSKAEIARMLKAALDGKELPMLEPNAMCYMMSRQQYLSDDDMHWHPHMMWYVPGDAAKSWQANRAGVPAMAGYVPEDRMTVFLLTVDHWSDGAPSAH